MSDLVTAFGYFVLAVFRAAFPSPLVGEGGAPRSGVTDEGCAQREHPCSAKASAPSPTRGEGEAVPCAACPIIEEMDELRAQIEREIAFLDRMDVVRQAHHEGHRDG